MNYYYLINDLFYLQVEDIIPVCDEESQRYLESAKTEESMHSCPLLSLTDGYGYNLIDGTYCKLTNEVLLRKQKEETYMKHYPEFIKIANSYTPEAWRYLYLTSHQDFGRELCPLESNGIINKDCLEDNIKPTELKFEVDNYCEKRCKVVEIVDFLKTGEVKKVVDCRGQ